MKNLITESVEHIHCDVTRLIQLFELLHHNEQVRVCLHIKDKLNEMITNERKREKSKSSDMAS